MDRETLSDEEMDRVLRELTAVNRGLGGVSSSLATLTPIIAALPDPVVILDVGAGGADLPGALIARARGRDLRVVALDASHVASRRAARRFERNRPEARPGFVTADAFHLPLADGSVDIAHAAMMFHHFSEADIVRLLIELRRVAKVGVLVNDLHRHALAYHGITLLTRLFSRSRHVRNDAPLSVARGFTRAEIERAWRAAGMTPVTVDWHWAFRWIAWSPSTSR